MAGPAEQSLQQVDELVAEAQDVLGDLRAYSRGERQSRAAAVRGALRRANEVLRHAQAAAGDAPPPERAALRQRAQSQRKQVRAVEKELSTLLRAPADAAREELLGGAGADSDGERNDPNDPEARRSLEAGAAALGGQSASIDRSERVAEQSEMIGHNIVGNLRQQRDTIGRSIDTTRQTAEELGTSQGHIGALRRALFYGFVMQVLLVLVLVLAIVLLIYFRWVR
eukprot:TRINITY_DN14997_c0_g1_i1.p1 TRINITY_DN14997_c0_g1~~TRINITY_DN14997_c0_g1_i1.p1  ORF type:complete len:250 (+),score=85.99 TRINITY_DN14997_c0_g1_i1:75-752(+)